MSIHETSPKILLLTPPLTQLNTPYPATAYLKGFLTSQGYQVNQADLGIDLILSLFSYAGLKHLFHEIKTGQYQLSASTQRMVSLETSYLRTIDTVIRFLQNKDTTPAYRIAEEAFLPEGSRFSELEDMDWAFGAMGIHDRSRFLATLYLDDLADLIKDTVSPEFGFSRYGEKLGLASTEFAPIQKALETDFSYMDHRLAEIVSGYLKRYQPEVVGLSVPFPGCLYGALRTAQIIKSHSPKIPILLGGGYVTTELREMSDPALFAYVDYVTLDNGELPFLNILKMLSSGGSVESLQRTFLLSEDKVLFLPGEPQKDIPFTEVGTPDYSDLPLNNYLSVLEIANPMHRLWNDGRWNKLTLAQGCYWRKCAFCDTSLDYIRCYQTVPLELLMDRIESIIAQTGQTGFHFVDEAAPPMLLKNLALEILRRNLAITWWTNIRFEKNYTADLCRLLAASGCIAVAGGLETASDRLLNLMQKGVTVQQTAQTLRNFKDAGILAHAYLMYGFPTQTDQETIDSLEIVRQYFRNGLIQSCFWHRFSLTAHSAVFRDPKRFKISITGPQKGHFAWNDLRHEDSTGGNHDHFSSGLTKAVYNFMYGIGLDYDLDFWFEGRVPRTTISAEFIESSITAQNHPSFSETARAVWLEQPPQLTRISKKKKGKRVELARLSFHDHIECHEILTDLTLGEWICSLLTRIQIHSGSPMTLREIEGEYQMHCGKDLKFLQASPTWSRLKETGLLVV